MSPIPTEAWPTATLDGVRRLRVLAAVLPGVHLEEREVERPFERVWAFMTDLERNVPRFDRDVASVRVTRREGNRLRIVTRVRRGLVVPFRVEIESGFMLMQAPARAYVVGSAAHPLDTGRTRYAHLEGVPRRVGEIASARIARHVNEDIEGIARLLDAEE
jgi:hypothetical protein